MSKKLSADNRDKAATGKDQLKLFEPPGTIESNRVLKGPDPERSPDARPKSEGTTLMRSREISQPINREVTLDLRSHCPVCGQLYQPGERLLTLACLSFAPPAVPCAPATANGDPTSPFLLGHHTCVLPRLLTLLAGFQPELRFVRAANAFSAGESVPAPAQSPERRQKDIADATEEVGKRQDLNKPK